MKHLVYSVAISSLALLIFFLGIVRGQTTVADNQALLLTGVKIYTSPTASPITSGAVLIRNGKIVSVGPVSSITAPKDAKKLDCNGTVIVAGEKACPTFHPLE